MWTRHSYGYLHIHGGGIQRSAGRRLGVLNGGRSSDLMQWRTLPGTSHQPQTNVGGGGRDGGTASQSWMNIARPWWSDKRPWSVYLHLGIDEDEFELRL